MYFNEVLYHKYNSANVLMCRGKADQGLSIIYDTKICHPPLISPQFDGSITGEKFEHQRSTTRHRHGAELNE
jgi:hypothetical protein